MRKYYVGMDVHKLSIAIAVLDAYGKLVSRTVIETTTEAVRMGVCPWVHPRRPRAVPRCGGEGRGRRRDWRAAVRPRPCSSSAEPGGRSSD